MNRATTRALLLLTASFAAGAAVVLLFGRFWRSRLPLEESFTDTELRERVRNRIADLVGDPDAIDVEVQDAVVRVRGRVGAAEIDLLLMELAAMPGVYRVRNALTRGDSDPF